VSSTIARPAPIKPASRRLSQMVIPLCHSWYRARRAQFGPTEGKYVQDLSSAVDLLVWSPLANLCHCRSSPIIGFRLAGAQRGAFSRRSRKVQQPACAHARTARPHIHLNTQILSATDDHVALSTRRRVRLESHGLDNGQLGQPSIRVWSSSAKNALL